MKHSIEWWHITRGGISGASLKSVKNPHSPVDISLSVNGPRSSCYLACTSETLHFTLGVWQQKGEKLRVYKMDNEFEDLELREAQREYLDFLDDDV